MTPPKTHGQFFMALAAAGLIAAALGAGCAADRAVDPTASYFDNLTAATSAITAGDLDEASRRIEAAAAQAQTPQQEQQTRSLRQLVVGIEAYRAGDAEAARRA